MNKLMKTGAAAALLGLMPSVAGAQDTDLAQIVADNAATTSFVFNTLLFLIGGFLVMWMGAGFAMLEAGLVRTKNVSMQCLKNIMLYSVAGIMFWVIGYNLMYTGVDGGFFGGFLMVICGVSLGIVPIVFIGGAMVVAAIPFALTFTNDSPNGQKLFGAIGAFVYVAGFWAAGQWLMYATISEATETLLTLAAFSALLCTFIGNVGSLRK
mgnify:CR=1 FL=1